MKRELSIKFITTEKNCFLICLICTQVKGVVYLQMMSMLDKERKLRSWTDFY